jgi:hypothetical protein
MGGRATAERCRPARSPSSVRWFAPRYWAARGVPETIADLAEHEALAYWRNEQLFDWTFADADGARRIAKLNWRFQFDDHEAIVDAPSKV